MRAPYLICALALASLTGCASIGNIYKDGHPNRKEILIPNLKNVKSVNVMSAAKPYSQTFVNIDGDFYEYRNYQLYLAHKRFHEVLFEDDKDADTGLRSAAWFSRYEEAKANYNAEVLKHGKDRLIGFGYVRFSIPRGNGPFRPNSAHVQISRKNGSCRFVRLRPGFNFLTLANAFYGTIPGTLADLIGGGAFDPGPGIREIRQ